MTKVAHTDNLKFRIKDMHGKGDLTDDQFEIIMLHIEEESGELYDFIEPPF